MIRLVYAAEFKRAYKRIVGIHPEIAAQIQAILDVLAADPFNPVLCTHKLKGRHKGVWACSVACDCRILFEFTANPQSGEKELLLLTMGTHDEVY